MAICHANGSNTLAALTGLAPDLIRKGMRVRRGRLIG
jgi:crossover junction endodeoxyribonuclease RuvC